MEQRQRREVERHARERQDARTASFGIYFRLTLILCLAISIAGWPYHTDCGLSLWTYLTAVVILVAGGIWTAAATWQYRAPRRHVIALVVALWGLILGASQILPRVGYAVPTADRPSTWSCATE